mgnify:FL=1
MNETKHAQTRAQQRCIPPIVSQWLDRYGEEQYDGHGGVKVYFSRKSKRKMERELGRELIQYLSRYLRAYKVESTSGGHVITYGWITKSIHT